MGLFSKPKDISPVTPEPPAPASGQAAPKNRPTPSRREAEAARMARLHPELDPKKAKELNREASSQQRRTQLAAVDNLPERALMRDVVDSRFNLGEFALPAMLLLVALVFIPPLQEIGMYTVYVMWAIVVALAVDWGLMYTKFRRLAAERLPGQKMRGMGFYGWNRQMSFRRWRLPAPRVKRGEAI